MENAEARKILFEELGKNVPNRDVCRVATKEQIEKIMEKVNFEATEKYLETKTLGLTAVDMPRELLFEMVLYELSTTKWLENENCIFYMDDKFWNLEDKVTRIFIREIKKTVGLEEFKELTCLKLDDFLRYAKSDEPSL